MTAVRPGSLVARLPAPPAAPVEARPARHRWHRARAVATVVAAGWLLPWLAGCVGPMTGESRDPTVPDNDYQMAQAISEARRTLPDFFVVAASPPADTVGFRLRVSISDGTRREFVWVMPYQQLSETAYIGTAAEQPAYLTNLALGQELRFDRSAIVDWGYTANGHDIGSRTVCVMLQRMPKERADQLRREHRMSC